MGLVFRFATVSGQRIDWRLVRNCSVTPVQLGWMYLSLCVVSLAIEISGIFPRNFAGSFRRVHTRRTA